VREGGIGVYFRHDERDARIHPPEAALVDDDAAGFLGPGDEILGDGIGRAADRQVDALEGIGLEFFDRVFLTLELDLAAGRAGGGEEGDLLEGEVALFEHVANELTHGAGGAHDGNRIKHLGNSSTVGI
jgi:hypothetical protein